MLQLDVSERCKASGFDLGFCRKAGQIEGGTPAEWLRRDGGLLAGSSSVTQLTLRVTMDGIPSRPYVYGLVRPSSSSPRTSL